MNPESLTNLCATIKITNNFYLQSELICPLRSSKDFKHVCVEIVCNSNCNASFPLKVPNLQFFQQHSFRGNFQSLYNFPTHLKICSHLLLTLMQLEYSRLLGRYMNPPPKSESFGVNGKCVKLQIFECTSKSRIIC